MQTNRPKLFSADIKSEAYYTIFHGLDLAYNKKYNQNGIKSTANFCFQRSEDGDCSFLFFSRVLEIMIIIHG